MAKTLAELNANPYTRVVFEKYDITRTFVVGKAGRRGTGEKLHIVQVNTVTGLVGDGPHRMKVGDVWTIFADCNTNGNTGRQIYGASKLDLQDVTCEKCRRAYGLDTAEESKAANV